MIHMSTTGHTDPTLPRLETYGKGQAVKLVRDRIGDVTWPDEANKRHLGQVDIGSVEYRQLLREKLFEEVGELADADRAGGKAAVIEELADVLEVLVALIRVNGIRPDGLGTMRAYLEPAIVEAERKWLARGGFSGGRTYSGPERAGHPGANVPEVDPSWGEADPDSPLLEYAQAAFEGWLKHSRHFIAAWEAAADAVLTRYDEEWPDRKAGM